jgi:hypothetical protein
MSQHTSFPGSRYIQYSAPEIPKRRMNWFVRLLAAFALLLALGVAYGFWRISNVPSPELSVPASGAAAPAAGTPR